MHCRSRLEHLHSSFSPHGEMVSRLTLRRQRDVTEESCFRCKKYQLSERNTCCEAAGLRDAVQFDLQSLIDDSVA